MAFLWFMGGIPLMFLLPLCVVFLVFGTRAVFPKFFRLKLKRLLSGAICVFGCFSPFILFMVSATTGDIFDEYVSSSLYSKFRTALPGWYVWDVHSCHGEWNTFMVGFWLIIAFHVLLFARFLVAQVAHESPDGSSSHSLRRDSMRLST